MDPDKFLELIKSRRSIRRFLPDEIPEDIIDNLLMAAIWAPSAGNLQPLEIVIVKDQSRKNELAYAAYDQSFITEAPVIFVIAANIPKTSSEYKSRGEKLYVLQDTAAAIQNILLQSWSYGLGSCWIGSFDEEKVSEICKFPNTVRPVALIPIGKPHPEYQPSSETRSLIDDFVYREHYDSKN